MGFKVALFNFYPPCICAPGGADVMLAKVKSGLEELGIQVDLFNHWTRTKDFDILHVFGATYETARLIESVKRIGKKVVVSTIFDSSKPFFYWWLWRRFDKLIPIDTTYTMRKKIFDMADILVAGSKYEARLLSAYFGIDNHKIRILPWGIDGKYFENANSQLFTKKYGLEGFILMVSRVLPYKGQVRLIQAVEGTDLNVVFVGPLDPTFSEENKEFLNLIKRYEWAHYLGPIGLDDPLLASAYKAAKVHVLPSLLEYPGAVTLEAAACGTAVASGKYPVLYEYVGENIYYLNPKSLTSIRATVLKAYLEGPKTDLRDYILKHFTWKRYVVGLIEIYKEVNANLGAI